MRRRDLLSLLLSAPVALHPAFGRWPQRDPAIAPPPPPRPASARVQRYMLGFALDEGVAEPLVDPGRVALYRARPQIHFKSRRLVIPSVLASNFELLNVAVLGRPALSEQLPAELFSETEFNYSPQFVWDTCAPGDEIVMAVQNVSREPSSFTACMIGEGLG